MKTLFKYIFGLFFLIFIQASVLGYGIASKTFCSIEENIPSHSKATNTESVACKMNGASVAGLSCKGSDFSLSFNATFVDAQEGATIDIIVRDESGEIQYDASFSTDEAQPYVLGGLPPLGRKMYGYVSLSCDATSSHRITFTEPTCTYIGALTVGSSCIVGGGSYNVNVDLDFVGNGPFEGTVTVGNDTKPYSTTDNGVRVSFIVPSTTSSSNVTASLTGSTGADKTATVQRPADCSPTGGCSVTKIETTTQCASNGTITAIINIDYTGNPNKLDISLKGQSVDRSDQVNINNNTNNSISYIASNIPRNFDFIAVTATISGHQCGMVATGTSSFQATANCNGGVGDSGNCALQIEASPSCLASEVGYTAEVVYSFSSSAVHNSTVYLRLEQGNYTVSSGALRRANGQQHTYQFKNVPANGQQAIVYITIEGEYCLKSDEFTAPTTEACGQPPIEECKIDSVVAEVVNCRGNYGTTYDLQVAVYYSGTDIGTIDVGISNRQSDVIDLSDGILGDGLLILGDLWDDWSGGLGLDHLIDIDWTGGIFYADLDYQIQDFNDLIDFPPPIIEGEQQSQHINGSPMIFLFEDIDMAYQNVEISTRLTSGDESACSDFRNDTYIRPDQCPCRIIDIETEEVYNDFGDYYGLKGKVYYEIGGGNSFFMQELRKPQYQQHLELL